MAETTLREFRREPVRTADTRLAVQVSADDPLPIGSHTVELVVTDNAGNASRPARVRIIVEDSTAPTAVLRLLDLEGRPLENNTVEFGQGFVLSGEGSRDSGPGSIESYTFTLLE